MRLRATPTQEGESYSAYRRRTMVENQMQQNSMKRLDNLISQRYLKLKELQINRVNFQQRLFQAQKRLEQLRAKADDEYAPVLDQELHRRGLRNSLVERSQTVQNKVYAATLDELHQKEQPRFEREYDLDEVMNAVVSVVSNSVKERQRELGRELQRAKHLEIDYQLIKTQLEAVAGQGIKELVKRKRSLTTDVLAAQAAELQQLVHRLARAGDGVQRLFAKIAKMESGKLELGALHEALKLTALE